MININTIYYVEINLFCIVILLLFKTHIHNKVEQMSTSRIIFYDLIWTTILLCASDMIAGIFRGKMFLGAKVILELSNLIYYEALTLIAFLWLMYVFTKLNHSTHFKRKKWFIWGLPLLAISVLAILNPFIHFLFQIDDNNLYHRNIGIYVHWIVTWMYLLIPTAKVIIEIIHEKNKLKRQEYFPLLCFIIAPVISSVLQMCFYGVSCSQVGVTISIVMLCISVQSSQVFTDALTGLPNRRAFSNYLEDHLQHRSEDKVSLIMIDLNHFKDVNDKYGHIMGDEALKDTANCIRQVCREMKYQVFFCRYGGDEFVIAGTSLDEKEILNLKSLINEGLRKQSGKDNMPYTITISMGSATGICLDIEDTKKLLHAADEAMYKDKNRNSI